MFNNNKKYFSTLKKGFFFGYNQNYIDSWSASLSGSFNQSEKTFLDQLSSSNLIDKLYALVGLKIISSSVFLYNCEKISDQYGSESVLASLSGCKLKHIKISDIVTYLIQENLKSPFKFKKQGKSYNESSKK